MALTTAMTCRTSLYNTVTDADQAVLFVRVQERRMACAKSLLRCCWRSRRIWTCLGAFARRWRLCVACARKTEGWGSAEHI